MAGGQSDGNDDAIRAEPVIRYLANAELTDPLWRDPRVVPAIFPGPYRVIYEAMVLAYQRELPRTAAIIARCTLELGTPFSESDIEAIIRDAEYVDSDGVTAQVELLIQERDRKELVARLSTALREANVPGVDPTPIKVGVGDYALNGAMPVAIPLIAGTGRRRIAYYAQRERGQLGGLSSGLRSLDQVTNGFPPKFLVVIGARVSVGKSAFAMQLGRLYVKQKRRVMYFSLELTRDLFLDRWIVQDAGISFARWQSNSLLPDETERLAKAAAELDDVDEQYMMVYASGELGEQTRNTIVQLVMREPRDRRPEVIVVDLITNLRPVPTERMMPPWERLDRETEALRDLAIATNATVFVVVQLNRDMTKRKDRRPQLSDIRSSGAIEQNADQVILMDNPEVTRALDRGMVLGPEQQIFLNVNKNRNGGSGNVEAIWQADSMLIRDLQFTTAAWGRPAAAPSADVSDLFSED